MRALFTAHPAAVGETYWQHARFAGRFGRFMIATGCIALLHAVCPWWCHRTASNRVLAKAAELAERYQIAAE